MTTGRIGVLPDDVSPRIDSEGRRGQRGWNIDGCKPGTTDQETVTAGRPYQTWHSPIAINTYDIPAFVDAAVIKRNRLPARSCQDSERAVA